MAGEILLLLTAARRKEEERLLNPLLLLLPLQLAPAALEARQAAVAIDGKKEVGRKRENAERKSRKSERALLISFFFLRK